ncbi:MAG: 1-acyl-sn-glycerol-3-phosphate acyltransferase [Bacteroidales bacterium OttesenSCG-928-I14]|jgi:putative hemolysin|nr:1-acyl-sn-glycerol-3-phosphate acyltransferase [Bacteroidales bacterium OttesenSCG-928-I14]
MREKLINIETLQSISPIFKKWYGPFLAKCIVKICGFDAVNYIYDIAKYETEANIEDTMIEKGMGIIRNICNIGVLKQFNGKPFITVSNHPYGHIDGIILIGEISKLRPDFKIMVNWILNLIDIMKNHFIGVNSRNLYGLDEHNDLKSVKECILHLRNNHPLGFFPAGAISNNIGNNKVKDREWQDGVIKLIKKANVPIVPVYISGQNSWFFNFLDNFGWRVRTLRLCHEITNKNGKTVSVVFGNPISVEKQKQFTNLKMFGEFLKEKTYELSNVL